VPLRMLMADDHMIVRQGIRALVERAGIEVVGEATNGVEAVTLAQSLKPDMIVLDLVMPVMNGIEAAQQIRTAGCEAPVILLTMHTEEHHVATALRAGVRGYVLKTQAAEDLLHAVRDVQRGQLYLSPGVSRPIIDGYLSGARAAVEPLSSRELQVLKLVAEGHTSKDIAVLLGLSVKTAESYRAHIMEKLDIHDTAGLVRYAIRRGLLEA
jgi:two-component system, NarL family, response regulator NreC